jgi:hypothetical protein
MNISQVPFFFERVQEQSTAKPQHCQDIFECVQKQKAGPMGIYKP